MLKFLNKILGRSSTSYENLMNSKAETNSIDAITITKAKQLLKELKIPAFELTYSDTHKSSLPRIPTSWPVNKKGEPLAYHGALCINEMILEVFMHEKSFMKDPLNLRVFHTSSTAYQTALELQVEKTSLVYKETLEQRSCESLPIWEELIHRDKSLHQQIVQLTPSNPWTLFKTAKKELLKDQSASIAGYLGGYPQWQINDMDYRKIEKAMFLVQLTKEGDHAYLFLDGDEIMTYYQRY